MPKPAAFAALTAAVAALVAVPTLASADARPTHVRPHDHACARQFDRAVDAYLDTTARRDARGFTRLLADDYTVVLPGGTVFAGKRAGAEFIARFFARTDWTQTFTETRRARQGCRSAVVLFDSTYTDGDGAVPLVIGLTWTREHGHWRVLQDQNTTVG